MRSPVLWILITVMAALAVGCSVNEQTVRPTAIVSPRFTAAEVEELFIEWSCPANPVAGATIYRPDATSAPFDPGRWLIHTLRGEFTLRESAMVFVPSKEAAVFARSLRSGANCQLRQGS